MNKELNYGEIKCKFEQIQPADCHEIQALLHNHFYQSSLGYRRSYPLFLLHQVLAEGTVYGVKVTNTSTGKLLGCILARQLGTVKHLDKPRLASLVTDLCLVPEVRGLHFSDKLLNSLYQVSEKQKNTHIHFFQVDTFFLAPLTISPLNTKAVYRVTNTSMPSQQIKPRPYTQEDFRKATLFPLPEFKNNPIYVEPQNPSQVPFLEVYEDDGITVVLRVLPELNQRNEDGAEVVYILGDQTKLQPLLSKTRFGWFEAIEQYTPSWTKVGHTLTYAFHLEYGNPAEHDLFYL